VAAVLLNGYAVMSLTWGAQVRAERARARSVLGAGVSALVLAGVALVVVLEVYVLARYPESDHGSGMAAVFSVLSALVLSAYIAFAVSPPFGPDVCALRWGGLGGAACALVWAVPAITGTAGTETGLDGYSWLFAILVIPPLTSMFAAARGRSTATGLQAGVWTAMIGTLTMFAVGVVGVLTIRHQDPTNPTMWHLSGDPSLTGYLVNDDIGALILALAFVPLVALAAGTVGAVVGKAMGRRPGEWIDFWIR
jgi:hypothetical protein